MAFGKTAAAPKELGLRLTPEALEATYLNVLARMYAAYRVDGRKGGEGGMVGDFARAVEATDVFVAELKKLER